MIELAELTPEDVVYDLGCGDGRVGLAAAAAAGCRVVGVDIETHWVETSRAEARRRGLESLCRFEVDDALRLDCGPATVVFLYLVQWSTDRIVTQLEQQCRPGTKVVSHNYAISRPGAVSRSVEAEGVLHRIDAWTLTPNP